MVEQSLLGVRSGGNFKHQHFMGLHDAGKLQIASMFSYIRIVISITKIDRITE